MDTDTGPADYMLFIDGKACGILEAKREGAQLGGVAEQSARYATSHTKHIERWVPEDQPLPFLYEATNHEIRFRDEPDLSPRSRYVFHFHEEEEKRSRGSERACSLSVYNRQRPLVARSACRTKRINNCNAVCLVPNGRGAIDAR